MIAVCVSGKIGPNYGPIIKRIKRILPYPMFFGTWEDSELPEVDNLYTFPEPKFDYHPMLDVQPPPCDIFRHLVKEGGKIRRLPDREKNTMTSATQILGHSKLVDSIPEKYTTIIRLRYDTIISDRVNFLKYIAMAQRGTVVGFGNFASEKHSWTLPRPNRHVKEYKHRSIPRCHYNIWDNMIIHPRSRCRNVQTLFEQKTLTGMEWGWYQVLCDQWFSNDYINVNGGVLLEKLCTTPVEDL